VAYPESLEVDAVVEAVMSAWPGPECLEDTVEYGVSPVDVDFAEEIIRDEDLDCTVDQVTQAITRECRRQLAEIGAEHV
jgi:hypothetical protein